MPQNCSVQVRLCTRRSDGRVRAPRAAQHVKHFRSVGTSRASHKSSVRASAAFLRHKSRSKLRSGPNTTLVLRDCITQVLRGRTCVSGALDEAGAQAPGDASSQSFVHARNPASPLTKALTKTELGCCVRMLADSVEVRSHAAAQLNAVSISAFVRADVCSDVPAALSSNARSHPYGHAHNAQQDSVCRACQACNDVRGVGALTHAHSVPHTCHHVVPSKASA